MEYSLKVTLVPSDKASTYIARVFVTADQDGQHVGTEQIWETKIWILDPGEHTHSVMWALMALRDMVMKLEPDAWTGHIQGSEKLFSDLFERKEHSSKEC